MKVLVIGAGMYVTGRDGTGQGTVLCSLAECSKTIPIEKVVVVALSAGNAGSVKDAASRINATLGTSLKVEYRSISGDPSKDVPLLMAKDVFDAAIVSVPDHLHFMWTESLISCGLHCLVVKPFTPTVAEGRKLVSLQRRKRVLGYVEFHKRYDETNLYIRKSLSDGLLGSLLYATIEYSQRISIPLEVFKSWAEKTNIFQYLGVHYVDLMYFLTGFVPVRAMAAGTKGVLAGKGIDTWDSVHATILWNGAGAANNCFVTQLAVNWIDPVCSSALSDQKYKVIGGRGRFECDQKNRGLSLVQEEKGVQAINPYFSEFLQDSNSAMAFGGYGHKSICQFITDVKDFAAGGLPIERADIARPSFRQSLVSTSVVESINRSLSNGFGWQEVEDVSQA